jgi:hypothetical protein
MRYLKMLGVAALAAAALAAIAGGGTASANEVCTILENPCTKNRVTSLHETLKTGTTARIEDTSGNLVATCTSVTRLTEVEKQGIGVKPVIFKETSTVFGTVGTPCTFPISTPKNGKASLTEGSSGETTETSSESEITVNTALFGSCVYGTGSGVDMGTISSGGNTLITNAVLTKVSGGFACPATTRLKAEMVITNHKAIVYISN